MTLGQGYHGPNMVHRHVSHELNSPWWLWARVTIILSWFTDLCRRWNGSGRRRRCGGISWVISTWTWWRSSASTSRLSRISRRSAARTRSSSANYGPDNLSRPACCSFHRAGPVEHQGPQLKQCCRKGKSPTAIYRPGNLSRPVCCSGWESRACIASSTWTVLFRQTLELF